MPGPQEEGRVPPKLLLCRSSTRRLGKEPFWAPHWSTISPDSVLAPRKRYCSAVKAPCVAQSAGRLPASVRNAAQQQPVA